MNEYSQFDQQQVPSSDSSILVPSPRMDASEINEIIAPPRTKPKFNITWNKLNPLWWYVPSALICLAIVVWSIQKGKEASVETVPTAQSERSEAQEREVADEIISEQVDTDALSVGTAARIVIERESSALFQRQVSDTHASMLRSMEDKNFATGVGTKPRMVSCFALALVQCADRMQKVLEGEYRVYSRLGNSLKLAAINNQLEVLTSVRKGEVSRPEFNPSTLLLARKAEAEAIRSLQEETTEGKAARALKAKQQMESDGEIRGGKP